MLIIYKRYNLYRFYTVTYDLYTGKLLLRFVVGTYSGRVAETLEALSHKCNFSGSIPEHVSGLQTFLRDKFAVWISNGSVVE